MKALCIADIHGDITTLSRLNASIPHADVDLILLLGDYSRGYEDPVENSQDIMRIVEMFEGYRIGAIPGNCDQKEIVDYFIREGINLHKTVMKTGDVTLVGLGGSNPTPFNTPFELSEEEIMKDLENLHKSVSEGSDVVLAVHAPPYGTKCDQVPDGTHVGSKSVRAIIEDKKPKMVICSHIHESGGQTDMIGETQIINLGRLSDGHAYMLDLEKIDISPYLD
jgi:uncharacterized protein